MDTDKILLCLGMFFIGAGVRLLFADKITAVHERWRDKMFWAGWLAILIGLLIVTAK